MYLQKNDSYSSQVMTNDMQNIKHLNLYKFDFMPILTIRSFGNMVHFNELGITHPNNTIDTQKIKDYIDLRMSVSFFENDKNV